MMKKNKMLLKAAVAANERTFARQTCCAKWPYCAIFLFDYYVVAISLPTTSALVVPHNRKKNTENKLHTECSFVAKRAKRKIRMRIQSIPKLMFSTIRSPQKSRNHRANENDTKNKRWISANEKKNRRIRPKKMVSCERTRFSSARSLDVFSTSVLLLMFHLHRKIQTELCFILKLLLLHDNLVDYLMVIDAPRSSRYYYYFVCTSFTPQLVCVWKSILKWTAEDECIGCSRRCGSFTALALLSEWLLWNFACLLCISMRSLGGIIQVNKIYRTTWPPIIHMSMAATAKWRHSSMKVEVMTMGDA